MDAGLRRLDAHRARLVSQLDHGRAPRLGECWSGQRSSLANHQLKDDVVLVTADCPRAAQVALKLRTGTTTVLKNSLDLERCQRRVSPVTDDEWLTKCELASPPCLPIPAGTHRPRIG